MYNKINLNNLKIILCLYEIYIIIDSELFSNNIFLIKYFPLKINDNIILNKIIYNFIIF